MLIVAAISLSLPGCMLQGKNGIKSHTVGQMPARHVQHAAPRPVNLRGPLDSAVYTPQVIQVSHPAASPKLATAYARPNEIYRLDSGDRLRIVVFGQENLSRDYAVDGGGYISMPLIGGIQSRGSTTFELEDRIAARLRTKYVKDPKVTVEIQNYRPFFILGEVRRPGQFPFVYGMTIRTAVAIAGGYSERARERKVKLTRRINGRDITTKVPDNTPVRPGDTIYVTERIF